MPMTPPVTIPLPTAPGDADSEPGVPRLDAYLLPGLDRPIGGVLICPGGGYALRSSHEGTEVARAFNSEGLHAFVLQYRVKPARHPLPLRDAVNAMRLLRARANSLWLDADHIAACGFSAGGHLAGCLALMGDSSELDPPGAGNPPARPDALILCYAVITSGPQGHAGTIDRLLGRDATPEERARISLEHRVTPDAPPTFIWQTSDDPAVPLDNALLLASALRRAGLPLEMHVYPHGGHGLGLAREKDDNPRVAEWFPQCLAWLRERGWPFSPS